MECEGSQLKVMPLSQHITDRSDPEMQLMPNLSFILIKKPCCRKPIQIKSTGRVRLSYILLLVIEIAYILIQGIYCVKMGWTENNLNSRRLLGISMTSRIFTSMSLLGGIVWPASIEKTHWSVLLTKRLSGSNPLWVHCIAFSLSVIFGFKLWWELAAFWEAI